MKRWIKKLVPTQPDPSHVVHTTPQPLCDFRLNVTNNRKKRLVITWTAQMEE